VLATVASATLEDGVAALDAAVAAFAPWATRSARERAEILRKVYEPMMAEHEALARLVTLENGKALPDSRAQIAYAAEFFRWNAEESAAPAISIRRPCSPRRRTRRAASGKKSSCSNSWRRSTSR
jgi:acyl-CoA reductase-like NAD-dependent aldehyde dehydrogenase